MVDGPIGAAPPSAANPLAAMAGGPKLPGNIAGGPSGPGATPALSPGAGAGNEAAADAQVNAVLPTLHKTLSAYQVGSKKYNGVLNAIRALTANFGKEQSKPLVPSAILQMAQAAKAGGPMASSPAPPIAPRVPTETPSPEPVGAGV